MLIHATTVALAGAGIVLRGPPGSGKSDLALRLIETGALLVSDDQTWLAVAADGAILASAPASIAGRLEIRGIGIVSMPYAAAPVRVRLVADLVPNGTVERLPEPSVSLLLGRSCPCIGIEPFQASAPAKLRAALHRSLASP